MAKLPFMIVPKGNSIKQVYKFEGYDARMQHKDSTMRDMRNLSTDEYPFIATRGKRALYSDDYTAPTNIVPYNNKLVVIDGKWLKYDGNSYELPLGEGVDRQLSVINTKVVVFPDKVILDLSKSPYELKDMTDFYDNMDETHAASADYKLYIKHMVEQDSYDYHKIYYKEQVSKYSTKDTQILEFGNQYVLKEMKLFFKFKAEGSSTYEETTYTVTGISQKGFDPVNNASDGLTGIPIDILDLTDFYTAYPTSQMTGDIHCILRVEKNVPDLEFVYSYNNKLYGTYENTIYVSSLGDPTTFFDYRDGIADNSFAVAVGSDGHFTGIGQYMSHMVFFKENCIHRLYGSKPANYQITTINCLGCEKGSEDSIVSVADALLYKSRKGIMAYSGDVPLLISGCFGARSYKNAVAGTDNVSYYVSMKDKADNKWYMFKYDTLKGVWFLVDNTHALIFANLEETFIWLDADMGKLLCENENFEPIEDKVKWMAELGEFDELIDGKKVYSKVDLKFKMEENSKILVSIKVDGGDWERIRLITTHLARVVNMPIIPRRCDKFSIRLEGEGASVIESVARTVREINL